MSAVDRRAFLKTTAVAGLAALPTRHGLASPADDDPLGVRADFPVTRVSVCRVSEAARNNIP